MRYTDLFTMVFSSSVRSLIRTNSSHKKKRESPPSQNPHVWFGCSDSGGRGHDSDILHDSSVSSSLITLNYVENLLLSRNLSLLYCVPTPNHPINPLGGCLGSVL